MRALGRAAVTELSQNRALAAPLPAQFSVGSLLWTMFFVALFFSSYRAASGPGMAIVVLVGYGLFLWRFVGSFQRKLAESDRPTIQ